MTKLTNCILRRGDSVDVNDYPNEPGMTITRKTANHRDSPRRTLHPVEPVQLESYTR